MAEGDFYAVAMLRNSIASATQAGDAKANPPAEGEGGYEGRAPKILFYKKKKNFFFLNFIFTPSPPKPPLPSNPAAGGNFSLIPPTGGLEGDFYAVALHSKPRDKAGPPTMLLRCIALRRD